MRDGEELPQNPTPPMGVSGRGSFLRTSGRKPVRGKKSS